MRPDEVARVPQPFWAADTAFEEAAGAAAALAAAFDEAAEVAAALEAGWALPALTDPPPEQPLASSVPTMTALASSHRDRERPCRVARSTGPDPTPPEFGAEAVRVESLSFAARRGARLTACDVKPDLADRALLVVSGDRFTVIVGPGTDIYG